MSKRSGRVLQFIGVGVAFDDINSTSAYQLLENIGDALTPYPVAPSIGRDFGDFIGYIMGGYWPSEDFHSLHDPVNLIVAFSSGSPTATE